MNYNEMKFNLTTDETSFDDLGCPTFNAYACSNIKIANINFNQTYYKFKDNELIAFRILAITITKHNGWFYPCYLVQFPNGKTNWVIKFIEETTKVFTSVKHYMDYVSNICGSLNLQFISIAKMFDRYINYPTKKGYHDTLRLFYTYKWSDSLHKAIKDDTFIKYLLITETSLNICTNHYNPNNHTYGYGSEEECVKRHLNGMRIVDFNDTLKVEIKIQPTNEPKVHILKFIEE
jgi:hypothetical protein